MGSKGQLPLDFFESVGICDGAPLNVFKYSFAIGIKSDDIAIEVFHSTIWLNLFGYMYLVSTGPDYQADFINMCKSYKLSKS